MNAELINQPMIPMLACMAGPGSGELMALLGILAIAWVGCGLLALANVFLILKSNPARIGRGVHTAVVSACLLGAASLFAAGGYLGPITPLLILGIPPVVVGQFIVLMRKRRSQA